MWLLVWAAYAHAQSDPSAPEGEPDEDTPDKNESNELDEDELDEIARALAADAQAREDRPKNATLGVASPTPTGAPRTGPNDIQLAFITDIALAAFSNADEAAQTGGHDPTVNGFNLQQVELAVGGAVDPYFRADGNIVFSAFGVEIEEFYATSLALPAALQVRAGQFLTRYGRINATHPHTWDFVDQALMVGRFMGGEGNRGLGAEISWLSPLPWSVEILASQTMANGAATARSFYGADDLGVRSPLDLQSTAALKQFFPLSNSWSLLWGLSYANGPNGTGRTNRSELYGTDLYLKFRPVNQGTWLVAWLQAEWTVRRYQVPEDVITDHMGYAQAFVRATRRFGVAGRYEYGSPSLTSDGSETIDPTNPGWDGFRQRISAAITLWPTEFSRLRLQGSTDTLDWVPQPVLAGFVAFEFNVGAHGAHRF